MPVGTSDGEFFEDEFDHSIQTHFEGSVASGVPRTDAFTPPATQVAPGDNNAPVTSTGGPGGHLNADPLDFTNQFNTPLTSQEQQGYNQRFKPGDAYDYDMQGWYKQNQNTPMAEGQHFPDTFKKPNHPTFSNESQYSTGDYQGGAWGKGSDGSFTFTPGRTNMQMHGIGNLKDYFNRVEPGNKLLQPK